jgi:hypothetical protein
VDQHDGEPLAGPFVVEAAVLERRVTRTHVHQSVKRGASFWNVSSSSWGSTRV